MSDGLQYPDGLTPEELYRLRAIQRQVQDRAERGINLGLHDTEREVVEAIRNAVQSRQIRAAAYGTYLPPEPEGPPEHVSRFRRYMHAYEDVRRRWQAPQSGHALDQSQTWVMRQRPGTELHNPGLSAIDVIRNETENYRVTGVETENTIDGGLEIRFNLEDRDGNEPPEPIREEIARRLQTAIEQAALDITARNVAGQSHQGRSILGYPVEIVDNVAPAPEPELPNPPQMSDPYGGRYRYSTTTGNTGTSTTFGDWTAWTSANAATWTTATTPLPTSQDRPRTIRGRQGELYMGRPDPRHRTPRLEEIILPGRMNASEFAERLHEFTAGINLNEGEFITISSGPRRSPHGYRAVVRVDSL